MSFMRKMLAASGGAVSDLRNPALWLVDAFAGRSTTAGQNVNSVSALTLSAYYNGIRVISEDVGKLPFFLLEQLKPRGTRKVIESSIFKMLHQSPNPEMSSMTFRETLTGHALGWGNGYAEIQRNGREKPVALWPIHPSRVLVKRDNDTKQLFYEVRVSNTEAMRNSKSVENMTIIFERQDIFHIHGLGDNGLTGFSVLNMGAESLGFNLAAQKFGSAFYGNGGTVGSILTHPAQLKDTARTNLRNSWNKMHQGADNASKIAILEEGVKFEKIGIPPDEAQFLQTRRFGIEDIARWFRLQPHKIGHLDKATFSNIEMQSIEYVVDTLTPWLIRWEFETKIKVLDRQPETYFAKIQTNALLRGDSKARANFYTKRFSVGSLSPDDIRDLEDENPIIGGGGNEYFVPRNLAPLSEISQEPQPTPTGSTQVPPARGARSKIDQIQTNKPIFDDAADRIIKKEEKALSRAFKKYETDPKEFELWAKKFYSEQKCNVVDSFKPILNTIALQIGCFEAIFERVLNEFSADFSISSHALAMKSYENKKTLDHLDADTLSDTMIKEVCKSIEGE